MLLESKTLSCSFCTEPVAEEEDAIDENDPLWIATLNVTGGDRERAMKLLEDPDALVQYPEIRKIMDAMDGDDAGEETAAAADETVAPTAEEWEKPADSAVSAETSEPAAVPESPSKEAATAAESASSASAAALAEETAALVEGDPREHLNLVFIGHVDAGKSTLSGSILYTMGKVDKRTIERYEKEAKDRNRESWFLAFIMDTSEEERAKGKTVEVGRAHFETEKNRYTILDAPGHKNYVPNMVSIAALAPAAVDADSHVVLWSLRFPALPKQMWAFW